MIIRGKPVEILLLEDNEGDVGLIEEFFEEVKIIVTPLIVAIKNTL
jgi:hypothetical protein